MWKPFCIIDKIITDREELNRAIFEQTNDEEDLTWFDSDEHFEKAKRQGWITYENGKTIIWEESI